ncbi:Speckle-type POZ protein B like protein [Argiope bruennichi]|uniref:Speckle-type POZ protein B like protein n=1 Tax=Argiope bruennichi TaxID=94029 RepID=A0A8T0EH77_ARGBR|nr:Speckle-type POZ protein B like protein [Argiope bruennichi]
MADEMALKGKCFSITWKIENMTGCDQKFEEAIVSPRFIVDTLDKTTWQIGMSPRGISDFENCIGLYLCRHKNDKSDVTMDVKIEFAFIGKDGSVLVSDVTDYAFSEDDLYGFDSFAQKEEIFNTKRSLFIPEDTLTVRCRIWKNGEGMSQHVQCLARTRLEVEKRSFLWNLKDFSTVELDKKCKYSIKTHMNDNSVMDIDMFETEGKNSDKIIRCVLSLQDEKIKYCTLRLSLVNESGNKIESHRQEFWFSKKDKSAEFTFFFTKKMLMENKQLFLPRDILTLHWELVFSRGLAFEEIEEIQYGCISPEAKHSDDNTMNKDKILPAVSFNDTIKSFYEEKFLCDVELKTSTSAFPAHKIILSASSSVFKDKLLNEEEEKESDFINIEDLEDDTVERMLDYIYTSNVEVLTWESASKLYEAANKYGILDLKSLCSSYVKDNLSPCNACEALLLAHNYTDNEMKEAVMDYIIEHGKEMKNSEWRLLMNSNEKLAADALYRLFCEE